VRDSSKMQRERARRLKVNSTTLPPVSRTVLVELLVELSLVLLAIVLPSRRLKTSTTLAKPSNVVLSMTSRSRTLKLLFGRHQHVDFGINEYVWI
jgi:hypothetical protein